MIDRQPTGTQQDNDSPRQAADRMGVSVGEAARRLDVTPDAIRARLHRGTLLGSKVEGVWRVFLDPDPDSPTGEEEAKNRQARGKQEASDSTDSPTGRQQASDRTRQDGDRTRQDGDRTRQDGDRTRQDGDRTRQDGDSALIAHLQGEIVYLREELSQRSRELAAERERGDVLQREALARIEALTAGIAPVASPDAPDSTEGDSSGSSDANAPQASESRRSWWRRMLGV